MKRDWLALSIPVIAGTAALYACVINNNPPQTAQGGSPTGTATATATATDTTTATATGTTTATSTSTGDPADAGAAPPTPPPAEDGGAPSADFTACNLDNDCVAVARNGCCQNGWKEAVASSKVDAYKAAFTCADRGRIMCPMYMVNDTRQAECNVQSKHCEMVAIDDIHCGGNMAHPHACPSGYKCAPPGDTSAKCVPQ